MGDVDPGKVAAAAGSGAAVGTAIYPGIGTAAGALIMGGIEFFREKFGRDPTDDEIAQAKAAQYGGNEDTNRLAALDMAEGFSQQQAANEREAAFYNSANQNFDIANGAQMRKAGVIQGSPEDQARQVEALNRSMGLADTLTDMGTRPMGDSYAEAQLRQGQAANMAQQLAMARSGRSLGSGQAAMTNAMFNNAALNQQTNQAAAIARIQEQNAYNQFQVNALTQAGGLAGQAGNQATTIRQGNEDLQGKNIANEQKQEEINNATSQIYNNVGTTQQGYGMDAYRSGQNAYQFGVNTGANRQTSQVNADIGHETNTNQVNEANANRQDRQEAANLNQFTQGVGTAAELMDKNKGASTPSSSSSDTPSNPNEDYKNITTSSHVTPSGGPNPPGSDENNKTNVTPLQPKPPGLSSPKAKAPGTYKLGLRKYEVISPDGKREIIDVGKPPPEGTPESDEWTRKLSDLDGAASKTRHAGETVTKDPNDKTHISITDKDGKTKDLYFPHGYDTPIDEDTRKVAVTDEPRVITPDVASYVETVNALQNAYRASQRAPADVLNRVPGAGAGPSASQSALLARFGEQSRPNQRVSGAPPINSGPLKSDAQKLAKGASINDGASMGGPSFGAIGGISKPAPTPTPEPASNWGDVFKTPQLSDRVNRYLAGMSSTPIVIGSPSPAPPPPKTDTSSQTYTAAPKPQNYTAAPLPQDYTAAPKPQNYTTKVNQFSPVQKPSGPVSSGIESKTDIAPITSDDRSKSRIRELEGQIEALGGAARGGSFTPKAPDFDALDQAYAREQAGPGADFRNSYAYEYDYKNPKQAGAAPGRQVGTMAQELEHTVAAPYVHDTPSGKTVDTQRLPLILAPAVGETQRRVDDLEAQVNALQGSGLGAMPRYRRDLYPQIGGR